MQSDSVELILLYLFRRWFLLRIWRKRKVKTFFFFHTQPSSCVPCCSAEGPDHNCYQLALVWLTVYRGQCSVANQNTYISGCNWNCTWLTQRHSARWYNSGQLWYLQEVTHSWNSFFQLFFPLLLSAAYCKQSHPEDMWEVRIRGNFTKNLRVLPDLKLKSKSKTKKSFGWN